MSEIGLLEELLDPVTECLDAESAQRLIDLRVSPAMLDYETLIRASDLITIL